MRRRRVAALAITSLLAAAVIGRLRILVLVARRGELVSIRELLGELGRRHLHVGHRDRVVRQGADGDDPG